MALPDVLLHPYLGRLDLGSVELLFCDVKTSTPKELVN
jgi:hypothetical protein